MIFIALAILVLLITIFMFVQKVVLKGRMERGLGRKVKASELTSLNAWMDASPNQSPNSSQSQKH